ncbi:MAG: hypothetical protein ACLGI3_02755, partial [Actinomycetes bacterium]
MIELGVAAAERPSAFEDVLLGWLGERPLRHSVDFVVPRAARDYVLDGLGHGRELDDGVPASVAAFAGLLEEGGQR